MSSRLVNSRGIIISGCLARMRIPFRIFKVVITAWPLPGIFLIV